RRVAHRHAPIEEASVRMMTMRRRAGAVLVGGAALALVLTACDGGGDLGGGGGGGGGATGDGDCSAYEAYGTFEDVTVTMSSTISDPAEADALEESWAEFESCTGITIQNNGTNEFESQIFVQVEGGNAPDIADFPQP